MRVLMVSKACILAAYRRKAEELAKLGAELTLAVPPFWRDERGVSQLEPGNTEGYRLVVLPMARNGDFHTHWYRGLARLMRETHPQLVHMDEEPYNLATCQGVALARRYRAASVFFTWQNLNRRYPLPFRLMERYIYSHVAAAIAGNQDAVTVLRDKGYRGEATVIPQVGVDPQLFAPGLHLPSDEFTIGYVGRLVPEKGVDLLLRAAVSLEQPWRMLILGSGPQLAALQALCAELEVSGRVEFLAPMLSEALPAHLRRLDCLVLPSLSRPNWKEQFGRVLVEAMACGVPVIGSRSGEIPNVIGEAGLIFQEGDIAALSDALRLLQTNTDRRAKLALAGRERVLNCYTQKQIARQTLAVYERALALSGAGRNFQAQ